MADLRAEMSKFIADSGAKETVSETSTEVEKETVENETETADDESQPEVTEKPKEVKKEEKDEESDDSEKDEKAKPEDKKKDDKPNRYQRVKKQRDEAVSKLVEKEEHFNKAVKVANAWRQEAKLLERELETVKKKAESVGYKRSPDEDRAFLTERELAAVKLERDYDAQHQKKLQENQAVAIKEKFKTQFLEDATALEAKYGVPARKILMQLNLEVESGGNASMEDIAKDLSEVESVRKRRAGVQRQIQTNDEAPVTKKPGKSVGVDYPATNEGMKRWLVSMGLASKD